MDYKEVMENTKKNIGPHCKACPVCNGIACRGVMPGPGGKGTGMAFVNNYNDLRKVKLNMDTIYGSDEVSLSTTIFGKEVSMPVFAAPIGGVKIHYSDLYNDVTYSQEVVAGCVQADTVAFTGDGVDDAVYAGAIEAIKEYGGMGIPTIKPWSKEEVILKAKMAQDAGAMAVAMDIDAAGLFFLAAAGKPVSSLSVEDIKEVVNSIDIPFVIKGIMTVKGAKKAIEAGAKGIVVSNHGGRVLDETPSTISVLSEIVEAVGGKMTIFVDGGFRSGLDVFKAIAMGADSVLIGRPYANAVYGGAREGVKIYSEKIKSELHSAMVMCGAKKISDIDKSMIRSEL
jgi:isopentenyl diphosphate isomerase/L-lactate dehydrogenase-like FMN-dependent dehydrogenase